MINFRHPLYTSLGLDWEKWRFAYEGGRCFIERYLEKFSARETDDDFTTRKKVTYCPAFAKSAVNEVKNSIFQRMADIARHGGSKSYQAAVSGEGVGVDRRGSTMNNFMGSKVLPELLVMKRVGIYTDMPELEGITLAHNKNKQPYVYIYKAEDILTWKYDDDNNLESVLVRDHVEKYEQGLPTDTTCQYRKFTRLQGKVKVELYTDKDEVTEEVILNIPDIPLEIIEISDSLMSDVADYQIALLNIASSDIGYILKSNYPFYTEQVDGRITSPHLATDSGEAGDKEVKVGAAQGRTYALTAERPGFIHPSPEPLQVSMAKQEQLKQEIRLLVHLAVSNMNPQRQASAETKGMDDRSLEAGLSYIGLQLQHAENRVSKYWAAYEREAKPATIKYPQKYSLKTDKERQEEAKSHSEQIEVVPSLTYKRELTKKIVEINLGSKLPQDKLEVIYAEIDKAEIIVPDQELALRQAEAGALSLKSLGKLNCFPEGEAEAAAKDHDDRLARIAAHQTEGISGASGNDKDITNKNRNKDQKDVVKDETRGPAQ
jgi:hypothetical protein